MGRASLVIAMILGLVGCSNTRGPETAGSPLRSSSLRSPTTQATGAGDVGDADAPASVRSETPRSDVKSGGGSPDGGAVPLEDVGLHFVAPLGLVLTGEATLLGAEPGLVEVNQGQLRVRPELSPGLLNAHAWQYSVIGRWPNEAYIAATVQGALTSTRVEAYHFDGRYWREVTLPHPGTRLSANFGASASSHARVSAVVHTQDWTPRKASALVPSISYSVLDFARGRVAGVFRGSEDPDQRCGTKLVEPGAVFRSEAELLVVGTHCRDVSSESAGAVLLETFLDGKRGGSVSAVAPNGGKESWGVPRFGAHVGDELYVLVESIRSGSELLEPRLLHRETQFAAVELPGKGSVSAVRGAQDTLWLVRDGALYGRRAQRWFRALLDGKSIVKTIDLDAQNKLWVETNAGTYWQGKVANPIRRFATEGPLEAADCWLGEVRVAVPEPSAPDRKRAVRALARELSGFPLDELLIADLGGALQFIGAAPRARELRERLVSPKVESRCGHGSVGNHRVRLDVSRGVLMSAQQFEASAGSASP